MEYPESRFTRPLRRALLIFFITIFFVSAPIIVLYTTGYRYDFHNGLLRETGSLSIDIQPETAQVYLDTLAVKDALPIRLEDITPQKYTVNIKAAGYYDWQKEIQIYNKQTTYIKEIILLKKSQPQLIVRGQVNEISLSPDGHYLIYTTIQDGSTLVFLRDTKNAITNLVSKLPTNNASPRFIWAKKNNNVAIATPEQPPHDHIFILQADDPTKMQDLAQIVGQPITKLEWGDTSEPTLYYSTGSAIVAFLPNTRQQRFITKNNYADWHIENDALWTMAAATTTGAITLTKDTLGFSNTFTTIALNDRTPAETDPTNWRILTTEAGTVLLGNSSASKMILVREDKKFTVPADTFLVSPYNQWLLMWTPTELWTYNVGEEPHLLNRSGESLRGAIPLDEFNTLALYSKKGISALYPYYLVQQDLIHESVNTLVADSVERVLYFGDKSGLWSLTY